MMVSKRNLVSILGIVYAVHVSVSVPVFATETKYQAPVKSTVKGLVEAAGYDYKLLTTPKRVFPKTKIVVYTFFTGQGLDVWKTIARDYKAIQPKVEVSFLPGNWSNFVDKAYTMIVAGIAPNIVMSEQTHSPYLLGNDLMTPLNSYIKADKWQKVVDDCFKPIIKRFTLGGNLYALPTDIAPAGMVYYNKRLLAEAGLPLPKVDWSWDDFIVYAKKQLSDKRAGYDPRTDRGFVYSYGGNLVDNPQNPTKFVFNSTEAKKGLQLAADLIFKHKVMVKPYALGDPATQFQNEKLAMFSSGIWDAAKTMKFDYDVTMVPRTSPTVIPRVTTGGTALGIVKGTKNQNVAWDFMKFACGPIGQCYSSSLYAQPVLKSLFWTELFANNDRKPLNKKILAEMTEHVVYGPFTRVAPQLDTIWDAQFGKVWSGTASVDQAVNSSIAQMQKLLDDVNRRKR